MPLAADGYVGGAEKKMVVNVAEGITVREAELNFPASLLRL